jgi:hypothetical protein
MYSPLDLSMLHRMRWQDAVNLIDGAGFFGDHEERCLLIALNAALQGEHFYIERSFQELVTFAEKAIPETIEFDMSWVLSECGWLELAAPIVNPDGIERSIVCWTRGLVAPTDDPERLTDGFAFMFMTLSPFRPDGDLDTERATISSLGLRQGKLLASCGDGGGPPRYCSRFLYALMHMMSERVAVATPAKHRENVRGQAVARGIIPANRPRVVMLRRVAEGSTHEANSEAHREYSFQWMVRGHWRQQPYRSVGAVRPVFIEAYVKGPVDKPLKEPACTVFVGRR